MKERYNGTNNPKRGKHLKLVGKRQNIKKACEIINKCNDQELLDLLIPNNNIVLFNYLNKVKKL